MGQVTVTLNGRSYRLSCADGEEERLRQLSEMLRQKLEKLVSDFGQIGETRLMMMSALLIADELLDAQAAADVAKETAAQALRVVAELKGPPAAKAPAAQAAAAPAAAAKPAAPAAQKPAPAAPAAAGPVPAPASAVQAQPAAAPAKLPGAASAA